MNQLNPNNNNKNNNDFSSFDKDIDILINDLIQSSENKKNIESININKDYSLDEKYLKKNKKTKFDASNLKNLKENSKAEVINKENDQENLEHIMSEEFKSELSIVKNYINMLYVNNKIKDTKTFMEFKDKENRKKHHLLYSITPNITDINKDVVTFAIMSQMIVGFYFEASFNAGWAGIIGVTSLFGGAISYAHLKMRSLKKEFLASPDQIKIILDKLKELSKSDKSSDMIKSIILIIKNSFLYEKDVQFLSNSLDNLIKIYYKDLKIQKLKNDNEILIEEILFETQEKTK